jgi:hypothetical protein
MNKYKQLNFPNEGKACVSKLIFEQFIVKLKQAIVEFKDFLGPKIGCFNI